MEHVPNLHLTRSEFGYDYIKPSPPPTRCREQASHSRSNSQSATFGNTVKEVASHLKTTSLSATFGSQVFRGFFKNISQSATFGANVAKSLVSVRSIASTFNFSASPSTFASHLRTDTLTVTFGNSVKEIASHLKALAQGFTSAFLASESAAHNQNRLLTVNHHQPSRRERYAGRKHSALEHFGVRKRVELQRMMRPWEPWRGRTPRTHKPLIHNTQP